ncbi:E3 ubiquitin-protein ligase SH3RF3 isoform X2 [Harmonia axyridis]|uniref:E3 ubiquitin-protein ligase SH3RF3 isoform X2 n=1 Tax=Harmonia axyridis TaxID=115357 RepID=UPI001E2798C7|nr:E3 ubiquitin-protein ligase SH3RF3 isoform X2 [Harmonia axyridis]
MDEGTLNDLLECSVCLERLDTSSKVLPCQHTFCKKCLEEIVLKHKDLRCPECRILVTIKVDDLPPNVLLMRILEGMKNAPNSLKQRNCRSGQVQPNLLHQAVQPPANNTPEHIISPNKLNAAHVNHQPYAKALYDYAPREMGDLTFKRGDTIILKRRIDNNWYYGECNGLQGVFPLSYVQIITPVPSHLPQCKALYDFRMTNDEEEGCLVFKKGDIIHVIRRVDENWAEGKLDGKIGIFPLAFVELNNLARSLMKLSINVQPGPSKVAPPTPTAEETGTPLIPTNHSKNVVPQSKGNPPAATPKALPTSDSSSTISSGSSSTTTPNVSSSNTSSSSSTAPSSPASPPSRPQGTPSRNFIQIPEFVGRSSATNTPQRTTPGSHQMPHSKEKRHSFTGLSHPQHNSHRLSAEITDNSHLSSPRRTNEEVQLPAPYIALYPYKPQKPDELELKKGGIYMVTDRCQDGWYKGTSNRTQKCGVFPGNYVSLAHGLTPAQIESKSSVSRIRSNKNGLSKGLGAPPELPPRAVSPSVAPSISSSWHGQQEGVTVPLGRSTSAIMTSGAQFLASASSTKNTDKSKERKERSTTVSLMKRLASMKRPKSPPNSSYSMDNPVFEDSSLTSTAQPVHVRSGSCPSQLLQVHSSDHRLLGSSSQRLKHKDRPSVLPSHRSVESTSTHSTSSPEVHRHRKSNSLDAGNRSKTATQTVRERYRCITPYPANSEYELELHIDDIIYVHKKRDDGWYKGTQQRTGKTGLFPASFVEAF